MQISLNSLSLKQTNIIKGCAIILIVLHNFLHLIINVKENEMDYSFGRVVTMLKSIIFEPSGSLNSLLSFFGHYGVQLFIFLSTYGLTKKYLNVNKFSYKEYIIPRLVKLYSLLILGCILFLLFYGYSNTLHYNIKAIAFYLLMINNFSNNTIFLFGGLGPWWFFGLIFQLYLIFPTLFLYIQKGGRNNFMILFVLSILLMYTLYLGVAPANFPVFGNMTGHLPEFLLGIAFAFFGNFKIDMKFFIAALVVFIISSLSAYTFPLSFISVSIVLLVILYPLYKNEDTLISNSLSFVGKISMIIFITNGMIRTQTLKYFPQHLPDYPTLSLTAASLLHLAIVIALSYIIYLIYQKYIMAINKKITSKLLSIFY